MAYINEKEKIEEVRRMIQEIETDPEKEMTIHINSKEANGLRGSSIRFSGLIDNMVLDKDEILHIEFSNSDAEVSIPMSSHTLLVDDEYLPECSEYILDNKYHSVYISFS